MPSRPTKFYDSRAEAIWLMRCWIIEEFRKGKTFNQVDTAIVSANRAILDEYRTENDVPGVRYWQKNGEDLFTTTGPGDMIDYALFSKTWEEFERHVWLSRKAHWYGYSDGL